MKTATIYLNTLEPGTHIARRTLSSEPVATVELPAAECEEIRPDLGAYRPIVTFSAVERALRQRGLLNMTTLNENQCFSFSVA